MYNITNVAEIYQGAKPKLQIIGPYTYHEVNHKFDISWNADATSVYYKYDRAFIPYETPCVGPVSVDTLEPPYCTLDDSQVVTVGNMPLMGIVSQLMGLAHGKISDDFVAAVLELLMKSHNGLCVRCPSFFFTIPKGMHTMSLFCFLSSLHHAFM